MTWDWCEQALEAVAERPGAPAELATVPAAPAAKRKKEEMFAWDAQLLSTAAGDELSFEEVCAACGITRAPVPCDYLLAMALESPVCYACLRRAPLVVHT